MKYHKKNKCELTNLNDNKEYINDVVEDVIKKKYETDTVKDLINYCIICNATTMDVEGDALGKGEEPRVMRRCNAYTKLPPITCRCLDLHIIPDISIVSNSGPSSVHPSELPQLPKVETKRFSLFEYPSYKVNRKLEREPYKVNRNLPPETQYTTMHKSSYSSFKLEPKKKSKQVRWEDKTLNNKDFCSYRKY